MFLRRIRHVPIRSLGCATQSVMTRFTVDPLPPRPNLEHQQKLAKRLLRGCGDVDAQERALAPCTRAKPCWLTEWGFPNPSLSCPLNDENRLKLFRTEREAFMTFVNQGRLAAAIYYNWESKHGFEYPSIFRCGALTEAGKFPKPNVTMSYVGYLHLVAKTGSCPSQGNRYSLRFGCGG